MNATHPDAAANLRLADHMRACVVDDQVVLLDLERSRYFALKGRHSKVVIRAMNPSDGASPERPEHHSEERALAEPLLRNRILTTAPPSGPARPSALPSATVSAACHEQAPDRRIRLWDVVQFFLAVSFAAAWLRWRSLESIAAAVHDLRRPSTGDIDTNTDNDEGLRLRHAVTVFDRLRPLTFTSRDKCLFDSLALAVFLGRQGLATSWVIGVSIRPFSAHSWIQDRSEVLNDVPENVRRFTPILVV